MSRCSLLAIGCAALALCLPAAALADGAGDNQYQDPFANVPTQPKQHKNQSSGTQGSTTPAPPSPAPAASSAPAQTAAAPVATSASGSLPRTGFPLVPVAAIGAALVAGGLVLRRLLA